MSRVDGPFKIVKRINDNAYQLDLQGKYNVSSSFNVSDLIPFVADESDLRSNPFQEEGDDAIMDSTQETSLVAELEPELEPELVPVVAVEPDIVVPVGPITKEDLVVPVGPITKDDIVVPVGPRARAGKIKKGIGELLDKIIHQQEESSITTLMLLQASTDS
ncbi:hypothetical protein V5N11_014316 [Cardamine amara subsp. amara]|uniref:Tf2-1-like SH3-like domain-containing protein n=1 Tax=Cardamine amara subsp. amara TaxID=228776 RepID=A0ABD0Z3P0_CARAN